MRVLLPPSETKRPGGGNSSLELTELSRPLLNPARQAVTAALMTLSAQRSLAQQVLKLSDKQLVHLEDNIALLTAPTLPAIQRYTGVLFDALAVDELGAQAQKWVNAHVSIQSSLFGMIDAGDQIPSYRLSASTSLPGITIAKETLSLKNTWQGAHESIWADERDVVLDLRSKDYVALAPAPVNVQSYWVNVVTRTEGGAVKALNHFNKAAKGHLVRALAQTQPQLSSVSDYLEWSRSVGVISELESSGQITLFADSVSVNTGENA
jgi:cytoplasmic iron level regulating protein YaaA (DUF328/UPF0246 family)